jgi:hypothetical protein
MRTASRSRRCARWSPAARRRGVRGVMQTGTYPSPTTLVTGVPPRIHGIVANKPLDRR